MLGDFSLFDYEMKRKNCRVSASTPTKYASGACDDNKAGRLRGTDPNRNYGGLWGGSGASTSWSDDTYRGDGPFSEPEVQNIRELISSRQVTNLITNHTFSNLVLRPPGVAELRLPARGADLQGAGRVAGRAQRLLEHPGLRALRHDGRDRGLVVLVDRRPGVHVRDRPDRVPPAVRDGVEAEYLGLAPADRRRQGRQPRGVLHDARRRPPTAALHSRDRGRGAGRLDAEDLEDVPDLDLARLAGRLRQRRSATRASSPTRSRPS